MRSERLYLKSALIIVVRGKSKQTFLKIFVPFLGVFLEADDWCFLARSNEKNCFCLDSRSFLLYENVKIFDPPREITQHVCCCTIYLVLVLLLLLQIIITTTSNHETKESTSEKSGEREDGFEGRRRERRAPPPGAVFEDT